MAGDIGCLQIGWRGGRRRALMVCLPKRRLSYSIDLGGRYDSLLAIRMIAAMSLILMAIQTGAIFIFLFGLDAIRVKAAKNNTHAKNASSNL